MRTEAIFTHPTMADSRTSHHLRIQPCGHHHLYHCESSRPATKTNHAAATTPRLCDGTTTTDPFTHPTMADSRTNHHSRIQPCGHHHLCHYESSRSATNTNHAAATTLDLHDATTTTDPFITALGADLPQFISRGSFTAAAPPLANKGSEPPLLKLHRQPPPVSQK